MVDETLTGPSPIAMYHEAAVKRLEIQIGTFDALDAKAWNALSIGSAILPITFGLLGFSKVAIPGVAWIVLSLAGVSYAALLGLSWVITRRTYRIAVGAPITTLRDHVAGQEYTGEGLQLWLANEYELSTTQNETTLLNKARFVVGASYALYLESAFLSLAAVATLILR
jgi:hypothetical protein